MLAGLGTLVALRLRRDRLTLALWTVGLATLWAVSAAAVGTTFDADDRRGLVTLIATNPALLVMRGAPSGTSTDAVVFVTVFGYVALLLGLMSTTLAVRHTRADEVAGRAEAVGATATGRSVPLVATLLAGLLQVAVVATAVLAAAVATGSDLAGSGLTTLGLLGFGTASLLVGVLVAQTLPTPRAANGTAAALVAAAFLLRGLGDAAGTASADVTRVTSGAASWWSPLGWATLAHPFADPPWRADPGPLLLFVPTVLALTAAAVAVERRRELGASLLQERPGPGRAGTRLGSSVGIALRQQRGAIAGWVAGGVVLGLFVGALGPALSSALADNRAVAQILDALSGGGAADQVTTFLAALGGVVAILASAAVVQGVVRLRHDELEIGETLLATPLGRGRWAAGWVAVSAAGGVLVITAFTVAAGTALAVVGEGPGWGDVLLNGICMLPVVLVYVAVTTLLLGVLPGTVSWLGWLLLLVPMLAGELVPLLGDGLTWVADLSPFRWLTSPFVAEPDVVPSLVMSAGALVASALAAMALRRRDLTR